MEPEDLVCYDPAQIPVLSLYMLPSAPRASPITERSPSEEHYYGLIPCRLPKKMEHFCTVQESTRQL